MSTSPGTSHGPSPLHTVQVLGNGGGGSGAHVRSLADGLVAHGLAVTVVAPCATEDAYEFTAGGASFVPLHSGPNALAVASIRAASEGADVVHAHGPRAGSLAALALRGRPTPLVVTWHARVRARGARAHLVRLMERHAARAAAVVLGASSDLVDTARRRGARDARLASPALPSPRGAPRDDDEYARYKTRAELGAVARPLLLTVGRLEPGQGYDSLLDAARVWRDEDPEPLLVVAGEGSQRPSLQRRIEEENLPVQLVGRRDDVPELLAAADVAVLPHCREGRPVLVHEALCAGIPLVAAAVGGVPDMVGEAAELVPPDDGEALAHAVLRLLHDPLRCERLTEAGRAQSAAWPTPDDAVAHVLAVYDELTSPDGE
ncbi:glycosyl transferase [Streptomyces mashuensis]|uniref:Glycosyl transferase n=1 Tax=Streptomyces mashuensis TaxID=33904 RepID=A0A919B3J8_9ACTN|nr:glycosyltransferase family 4 protein [Streptomyces mashuensis]GHF41189.1 glycosyl transferase [Streptomyces mashuensis]